MKHIHIVDPYQSAAMQRMTWPLLSELPMLYEVTTSKEVDLSADLNLHIPWHTLAGLEEKGTGKHIAVYTHCNPGMQAQLIDACERADLVTAMSYTGRQELVSLGVDPAKIWVIYAGADGFKYKQRTIGIVGYPQPNGRKRESLLLDLAWQYDLSAFQFLFLGLDWEELMDQLKSLGVSVAGTLHADTPEKIVQSYQFIDILLVTGYAEGGPLPLLEAMATGCKVLSPRFGYASDLLEEDCIYEDAADLMDKLNALTSESVRYHQLARAWSWQDYAAEYALIIGRLLGDSPDLYPERGASRYAQLLDIVDEIKPASICEIGTWNGKRAVQMLQQAAKYRPMEELSYQGFDLFEQWTPALKRQELSKNAVPESVVQKVIEATGAEVELVSGNTRETLSELRPANLFFVDGGHSEATIENDGRAVLNNMGMFSVAVFDDYYFASKPEGMGCNKFIDALGPMWQVTHLAVHTQANDGRVIEMVRVERKPNADLRLPMSTQAQAHSITWNDRIATYTLPLMRDVDAQSAANCWRELERAASSS